MRVLHVSTYPPRSCGIASYTQDLDEAVRAASAGSVDTDVIAITRGQEHNYSPRVVGFIRQDEPADYRLAAARVQDSGADIVCLQHEFGICGGPAGVWVNDFLAAVQVPVVTTLHSVILRPHPAYFEGLKEVCELSSALVVHSEFAAKALRDVYGVVKRVDVIPHGVPDEPLLDAGPFQRRLGIARRPLLSTFGLLRPNKGIETVIRALPGVLEDHPDALYLLLGQTHPGVVEVEGERYRTALLRLAEDLGVERNLAFVDRYLRLSELIDYLHATDVYVSPHSNPEQVVSGTLAYAVALGRPVVATAYHYATELLADGRGLLVPVSDSRSLAEALRLVLGNDSERLAMGVRAYQLGRTMTWATVAQRHIGLFARLVGDLEQAPLRSSAVGL